LFVDQRLLEYLGSAIENLKNGFVDLPNFDSEFNLERIEEVLKEVSVRLQNNYPYHHPVYAGQMMKPPHPVAWLAYSLAMLINPNNHAIDGGRASSEMEKEAVAAIAKMIGWEDHIGHLTGGGTVANLEALWIANNLSNEKRVAASMQAHYTHERICGVLNIPFVSVPCDEKSRLDVESLKSLLDKLDIGTVVVTIGTTATGSIDPLKEILKLQSKYKFRIHADAAYGGYFKLIDKLDGVTRETYEMLHEVDSIVIDPHKHGLQPYGCGCVLFKDPTVGRFYHHNSPYTYFTSEDLHLGEISLECSRAGASAVALWATQRLLPYTKEGEFARSLTKSREAAINLFEKLSSDPRFLVAFRPELDIVVWSIKAERASECSELASIFFDECAKRDIHLAKANLPVTFFKYNYPEIRWDRQQITCLRSCLMKPEHLEWLNNIWEIMKDVLD